ncbi:MAG: site-specific integrase, partial [Terriglobales bacterium]
MPHPWCLFALALTTGMRPSEYLALCWQDVDWDHGTVSVVRSLHRSEGQWHFEDTKRVRSRRVVKLQNWVVGLLGKVRRETQAATAERDCNSTLSELIFTTAVGEPINEDYLVKRHFKPILREAGLPDIRLYDLRHTAATLALTVSDLPPISVHGIIRQVSRPSLLVAAAGAVGKWETRSFAFSKLAVCWQA